MDNMRHRRRRRRNHVSKAAVLLTSLALILVIGIGGSLAYLATSDGPIKNIFNASNVATRVDEQSFNGTVKTNVTVANTGDTVAYIRAAIIVTWKNADNGDVYGAAPVEGTDYDLVLDLTDGWSETEDGYYLYVRPVESGDSTNVLITSCTDKGTAPAGYGLNVEILASGIQSEPGNVITDTWGYVIGTSQNSGTD